MIAGLLLCSKNNTAQITITDIHVVQSGRQVIQAQDTLPNATIQPGSPGSNMTWDFSGLSLHVEDTLNFVNTEWTPYEAEHPTSNLAARIGTSDIYLYMNISASGLFAQGISGDLLDTGTPIHVQTTPSETLAEFPLSYSNAFTSTSGQDITIDGAIISPLVDSIRLKTSKIKMVSVDAWGSLTTPMGNFDALRLNQTIQDIDSMWTLSFGIWSLFDNNKSSTKNYTWWTNDAAAGFPLVEMEYDTVSGNPTAVTYLKSTPAIGVLENVKTNVSVYPNPATDYVLFEFGNPAYREVYLYDVLGKTKPVFSGNTTHVRVDLSGFSAGMYFYQVRDELGNIKTAGSFVVNSK